MEQPNSLLVIIIAQTTSAIIVNPIIALAFLGFAQRSPNGPNKKINKLKKALKKASPKQKAAIKKHLKKVVKKANKAKKVLKVVKKLVHKSIAACGPAHGHKNFRLLGELEKASSALYHVTEVGQKDDDK